MKAKSNRGIKVLEDGDFVVFEYDGEIKAGVYHTRGDKEYLAYLVGGRLHVEELYEPSSYRAFVNDEGQYKLDVKYEIEKQYEKFINNRSNTFSGVFTLFRKKGGSDWDGKN